MTKEKKPIFIHSLFRTGSTYIWNKFRQNENYYCYYEPFHQLLQHTTVDNIENLMTKDYQSVNHPSLSKYYLYEYRGLLQNGRPGVTFFKKSFSFDEFCHNEENPDLKQYIDHLIMNAGEKIPLFQFNRSALRVKWFKKNYPESLNIYLVRKPCDQWQSYLELYKKTNYITFFVMDLLIASVNSEKEYFQPLAKYLPLIKYNSDSQENEDDFYRIILDSYSEDEKYLIFYYTWLRSMVENVLNADLVLNINLLSQKPEYRSSVKNFLLNFAMDGIEFKDANLKEYTSYTLPKHRMHEIEGFAREMIVQALNEDQINLFFQKIPEEDKKYFQFTKNDFNEKRKTKIQYNIREKSIEKFRNMLFLFSRQFLQQKKENHILKTVLQKKEPQLVDITRQLSEIVHELNKKEKQLEWRDELLRQKDNQLLRKDQTMKEKLDEKDRQLQWRDELLNKKDEQVKNMEQILNKKLEENNQQLALKHELLEQRFELSIQKEQALKKLVEEKDRQLTEKDSLLRKNEEHFLQKEQEWREKLKEKDQHLGIKDQLFTLKLKEKERQLKDLESRLSAKENQLNRKDNDIHLILNSYTYRTGKILLSPFIAIKRLIKKYKKKLAPDKQDKYK
jgi:hypothetical protein